MPEQSLPTLADVERIGALDEPVIRNLQITQCYHELALGLAAFSGPGANWCSFATWASKQAGQTIRQEDLARTFERLAGTDEMIRQAARRLASAAAGVGLRLGIDELLAFIWKVWHPAAAFERASAAVARGNLKVFAEIGREFARFLATCPPGIACQAEQVERFCAELLPGEPPQGQLYLRRAFHHYFQASRAGENKLRQELLLLGNLEIGLHEQTRLQPEINEALGSAILEPEELTRNLIRALFPQKYGWLGNIVWLGLRLMGRLTRLEAASHEFAVALRRLAQRLITETLMTITLPPERVLQLGEDLPQAFPAVLQQIEYPELCDLLAQIDPTPDSTRASGAAYWGELADRLHFIADLFRCYQETPDLFTAPFTAEQTAMIKDGHLPLGRL
jgi:hypothetical protein